MPIPFLSIKILLDWGMVVLQGPWASDSMRFAHVGKRSSRPCHTDMDAVAISWLKTGMLCNKRPHSNVCQSCQG